MQLRSISPHTDIDFTAVADSLLSSAGNMLGCFAAGKAMAVARRAKRMIVKVGFIVVQERRAFAWGGILVWSFALDDGCRRVGYECRVGWKQEVDEEQE